MRHSNVVALYEVGETDSWLYLVLEYIPGGTLKKRLDGPVPPVAAVELLARIAVAVEAIHAAGLLHLDLKPSNIMVDSEENSVIGRVTPKVADFGIARLSAGGETGTGDSVRTLMGPWGGTASYMAPEQIAGGALRARSGRRHPCAGAILYELLTGNPPFRGESVLHTLDMVRQQEPVAPRRINPCISRDLETITLKRLQKDPRRRDQSRRHSRMISRGVSKIGRFWLGPCRVRTSPCGGAAAARPSQARSRSSPRPCWSVLSRFNRFTREPWLIGIAPRRPSEGKMPRKR